jgi:hypothetical protein
MKRKTNKGKGTPVTSAVIAGISLPDGEPLEL